MSFGSEDRIRRCRLNRCRSGSTTADVMDRSILRVRARCICIGPGSWLMTRMRHHRKLDIDPRVTCPADVRRPMLEERNGSDLRLQSIISFFISSSRSGSGRTCTTILVHIHVRRGIPAFIVWSSWLRSFVVATQPAGPCRPPQFLDEERLDVGGEGTATTGLGRGRKERRSSTSQLTSVPPFHLDGTSPVAMSSEGATGSI